MEKHVQVECARCAELAEINASLLVACKTMRQLIRDLGLGLEDRFNFKRIDATIARATTGEKS